MYDHVNRAGGLLSSGRQHEQEEEGKNSGQLIIHAIELGLSYDSTPDKADIITAA